MSSFKYSSHSWMPSMSNCNLVHFTTFIIGLRCEFLDIDRRKNVTCELSYEFDRLISSWMLSYLKLKSDVLDVRCDSLGLQYEFFEYAAGIAFCFFGLIGVPIIISLVK